MSHKLVLATRNQGKITEFRRILDALAPGAIELIGVDQFPDLVDVEETGSTFEENSLLKARYTSQATGLPAIADDSGLCVDALNGDPGIFSARWAGEHGNDRANLEKVLEQLKDVADGQRTAHFMCVASLVLPDGRQQVAEGRFDISARGFVHFFCANERGGKGFTEPPRKITTRISASCHPFACEPGVAFTYHSALITCL